MISRNGPSPKEIPLLVELRAVYAETDKLLTGWSCPNTAECCQFGLSGKEPFVTSIELVEMELGLLAIGKRPGPKPKYPKEQERVKTRVCPMLTKDLKCSIYNNRPLGCRTFFCHRVVKGEKTTHQRWLEVVRKVQDIARRHRKHGEVGHPIGAVVGIPE